MHTDEQLADLPEALPLRRVSPFWLVLALLESVALVGLFLIVCVVGLAALRQRVMTPVTMAVPVMPPAVARGGFGTFAVARRKPRKISNPRTGKAVTIAGRMPRFKPSRELKRAVR